jgi:uncharacterized protein YqeY
VTILEKIKANLKEALLQQDKSRVVILRLLLSEIKNAEIVQRSALSDDKVLEVISREVKRHKESIQAFKQGNRNDLVAQEEQELTYLFEYLPEQIGHDELVRLTEEVISQVGAQGMNDKGKVMSQLMPKLKGKADGKEVNEIVCGYLVELQSKSSDKNSPE